MDFERNKEVKESIGIGIKANAPHIRSLYYLEIDIEDFHNDRFQGIARRSPIIISDVREAFDILYEIEMGKRNPEDYVIELETEDQVGSLEPLWKYRGRWLKFLGRGFPAVSAYDRPGEFNSREIIIKVPE